jgi:hypothetical protein
MATGGAYANPDVNVGVDRQTGRMIGSTIAGVGQSFASGITEKKRRDDVADERRRKEAEKAKARAEQNWAISKQVESQKTQEIMEFQAELKANNIDMDSLDGSFRSVIDEMYAAKSRLAQSRSDYDGRKEDEAAIRNGESFIGGIGEKFQTMNMLTSTWKEKFKTRDVPGGIDNSASDPLFAAMMNIGEGDGKGVNAGSVGWERRTGPGGKIQLFQVADSPKIRELNNGKPYELSYDQVSGFLNDEDNNPNTFGPFSLVPDHTKEIKQAGKDAGIFQEGGDINKEQFYSKGTEYIAVDGLGGSYGEQLSWPNTKLMQGSLSTIAQSSAEAELGFGGSSITANSNIRAKAKNRKKIITLPNGEKQEVTEYYFPTFGERDPQTGEIKETGEVILGDSMSGLMTQNNEDGTEETDGYGKEEYDNYLKFTEYQYMSQNGAYAPPEAIASEKREYINKPKGDEPKGDEDIGREYFKVFEDDPVKLWQSKTNDRTANMLVNDEGEETGVIEVTRDTGDGPEIETFDLNDEAQKEFFLTELMLSDPSLKGDSAAAKAKRDAILANLNIEKEEEAISEEENLVELADISDLATEFEDISSSMISIMDSSNVFNRSENLEKMINTAVDKFKGIEKNVSRDQIIQALIKMEKAKPDYAKKQKFDGAFRYSKENKRVLDLEKLLEK